MLPGWCGGGQPLGSDATTALSTLVQQQIPVSDQAVTVRATLYYQSIPPYYLRQRATEGQGSDTA
jgi:hypothetical protein